MSIFSLGYQSIIIFLSIGLVLGNAGCTEAKHIEQYQQSHNQFGQILIGEEEVILTSKHLASIKSELYQPSLFLYGTTVPVNKTSIQLPKKIEVQQLLVTKGQQVKQGQPLFSYHPLLPHMNVAHINVAQSSASDDVTEEAMATVDVSIASTESTSKTSSQAQPSPQTKEESPSSSPPKSSDEMMETQELARVVEDILEEKPMVTANAVTVTAPFTGTVTDIFQTNFNSQFTSAQSRIFDKNKPIMTVQTLDDFHFTSTLLLTEDVKSEIILGQHVNFIARIDDGEFINLSGQIIDISPDELGEFIVVNVHILPDEERTQKLVEGLVVQGKVDHGQMAVATLVAKEGVHQQDGYDLSVFMQPHAEVVAPVAVSVWTVNQDRQLRRIDARVVSYHPATQQYLVSGIPSDSLIVLADLPKSADGKLLKIS